MQSSVLISSIKLPSQYQQKSPNRVQHKRSASMPILIPTPSKSTDYAYPCNIPFKQEPTTQSSPKSDSSIEDFKIPDTKASSPEKEAIYLPLTRHILNSEDSKLATNEECVDLLATIFEADFNDKESFMKLTENYPQLDLTRICKKAREELRKELINIIHEVYSMRELAAKLLA
jgi:hypothetical protein